MNRRLWLGAGVCLLALVVACSQHSEGPTVPSGANLVKANAAPDGTTLKVTAPTTQSPINGLKLVLGAPATLVINNVAPIYVGTSDVKVALTYKFEIYNGAGAKVYTSPSVASNPGGTTSHVVTGPLDFNQPYSLVGTRGVAGGVRPVVGASLVCHAAERGRGLCQGQRALRSSGQRQNHR